MICGFFEKLYALPFFSTISFGIIAMVIHGSSWSLVGLVMGDSPKKGVDPSLVQLLGACISTAAGIFILLGTGNFSRASGLVTAAVIADYFIVGAMNFILMELMSYAMQRGPNGIVWAVIQSAMIFPFTFGVLFFDIQMNIFRTAGIFLLLGALACFGLSKDNSTDKCKRGSWRIPAFAGLLFAGIQQCLATLPSYYTEAREVSSITRTLASGAGVLTASAIYVIIRIRMHQMSGVYNVLKNRTLWKYIAVLQGFGLIFAYAFFYPGLDTMAANGLGGMCYPILVGSCILSFTLVSLFWLKEKMHPVQLGAMICCIAGLVLICMK